MTEKHLLAENRRLKRELERVAACCAAASNNFFAFPELAGTPANRLIMDQLDIIGHNAQTALDKEGD